MTKENQTNEDSEFDDEYEQEFSIKIISHGIESTEFLTDQEQFLLVGEVIQLATQIECDINLTIEEVIGKYLNEEKITNKLFSFVGKLQQNLSVSDRINLLILFLELTQGENEDIQDSIKKLIEISSKYNNQIRDVRDIVAHNPFYGNHIVPSRLSAFNDKCLSKIELDKCIENTKELLKELEVCFKPISLLYYRTNGLTGIRGRQKNNKQ